MVTWKHSFLCALVVAVVCGCDKTTLDVTRGRTDVCEIHHVRMMKKKVPIIYGAFAPTPSSETYHAACASLFPHAEDEAEGGCIVDTPEWAMIYCCPACELARHHWEEQNAKKP